jgi:hypothetical protein
MSQLAGGEAVAQRPSSAEVLAREFMASGIQRHDLEGRHLRGTYNGLKVLEDRPDFSKLVQMSESDPDVEPWDDEVVAVIIETRPLPELEYVVQNITTHTGLRVHVFHGRANKECLETQFFASLRDAGRMRQTEIATSDLNASQYNTLVLSEGFWERVSGRRKVLIFQTDALCCPGADFVLGDFLSFDYIGASWPLERPIGLRVHGGVGGFSLRDWVSCVSALQRFPARLWPGGEDGYFAFHIDLMGGKVAGLESMIKFGTQSIFRHRSFGAHRVQSLSVDDHSRFLEYCPEITNVLKWQKI